jgi:hypothetical protein
MEENTAPVVETPAITPEINSVTLSDGRVAIIRDATGKDQLSAQKLTDGNNELYLFAMLELCVEVSGVKLFISDYESMKLKDVSALTVAFTKVNF